MCSTNLTLWLLVKAKKCRRKVLGGDSAKETFDGEGAAFLIKVGKRRYGEKALEFSSGRLRGNGAEGL